LRRPGPKGVLAALIAVLALAILPSSAAAAPCPVNPGNATAWVGGSGSIHSDANWTNGTPSGTCDVSITAAGNYTVTMTGGVNTKSFVLGGPGSTPHLVISDESPNTNLDAQPAGITIAAGASVTLTCQPGGCPGGGPDINSGASPFSNAGTITVGSNTGGGAVVGGQIANTGTIDFERSGSLSGKVTNQSLISIDDGATATNSGSSCGDTGASVKNDTGGTITADGTGSLSVVNYEQGNGSVGGTSTVPINIPCGTLKYTGSGTSKVKAVGGFNLTGEIQPGQALTVSAEGAPNVNATLGGNLTNKGSITLTCTLACGAGGGAGFNINDKDFVNTGTFTVAAASGTGASIGANSEGSIANTGTMQFDQSAGLGGPVTNQGAINIANGKSVTSGGGCGNGASVKNDAGGSINATGTGALFVGDYEQGNGTSTGANPVQLYGGCLKYTGAAGAGASKVLAFAGFNLTGEMQAAQSLTVTNASANTNLTLQSPFTSKGSITFTCPTSPCNGPGFNGNGNLFTNAGTFTVDAAASSGTTLDMSSGGMTNSPTGTFQLNGHTNFNGGGPFSNQGTLRVVASANTPSFSNTGSVVLDQSATSPTLNTNTLTNAGTITASGASANTSSLNGTVDQTGASAQVVVPAGTKIGLNNPLLLKAGTLSGGGTLQGSVDNSGGTVAPGASPGTLTISNGYTQGPGGSLAIEIAGTGAGQFDGLAVGGNATLGGTVALQPTDGFADSAAIGDGVSFLTYGGTRTGQFGTTTVSRALICPKQITATYDDAGKAVKAVVSGTGVDCNPRPPVAPTTPTLPVIEPVPETKLDTKPKAVVKTTRAKASVRFAFSSPNVAGATFQCKLDRGAFAACRSPKSYKAKPGKHRFQVRAVGPGGTDASPASFSFKVERERR